SPSTSILTSCSENARQIPSLSRFERRKYSTVFGSLATHVEVAIRFESNLTNVMLGSFLIAVVGSHYTYGKGPVLRKNDTRVCPDTFQFSRLVSYLNTFGHVTRKVTLLQCR